MPRPVKEHRLASKECLNCTLFICNDRAAGCAYQAVIRRHEGRDYEARRLYHFSYYQRNRERKLAAAKARVLCENNA